MRLLVFTSLVFATGVLRSQPDWSALDERFHALFGKVQDNPMELQSLARSELFDALEADDCEAALVAHSLRIRAAMMLQLPPDETDWELTLPPGCRLEYPRLNYDIGCRLKEAGRLEEAQERFGLAAESPKWASHAWNMVGLMHHQSGDLKEASSAWQRAHQAVDGQPNPSVLINLGLVHSAQGNWHEALHWFQLALEAHKWNEETQAYMFLEDIEPLILLNLLRSSVNVSDSVIADQTWAQLRPIELTDDPVRQLRPQLDYALWRNRQDVVEGLVHVYGPHVMADTAHAMEHLNDRLLLFDPWRKAAGWSLHRAFDVLARAEADDRMRHTVSQQTHKETKAIVRVSQVRWMNAGAWAIWVLCAVAAAGFALRWRHFRAARLRLESSDDAALFARLQKVLYSEEGDRNRHLAVAALAQRLDRKSGMGRVSDEQLSRLNAQEARVLEWILDGRSSQEISDSLKVTVQRVYNIRSAIRSKLDLAPGQNWDAIKNDRHAD